MVWASTALMYGSSFISLSLNPLKGTTKKAVERGGTVIVVLLDYIIGECGNRNSCSSNRSSKFTIKLRSIFRVDWKFQPFYVNICLALLHYYEYDNTIVLTVVGSYWYYVATIINYCLNLWTDFIYYKLLNSVEFIMTL